ncbi:hypothetical protein K503DRAFT_795982 [Rhizopogon vinicolor AM-OR11-026]|uniref:Protein PBN1 n=1 Tax=Rhizopogon vinicolor AM-OR11-026 TaxID=1314800 RepID=A0A1B7NG48_9AGAM|nr:hypothetical protein K503DRAFT_795982 [Rhizopogon vinicolor AM-OR11-026]
MQAKGFHTNLSTRISLHARHEYSACDLFILYELPPDVIIDSFELNNHGLQFEFVGNANLELPMAGVGNEAGWVLVAAKPEGEVVLVDVPLHMRYGVPGEGHNPRHIIQLHPPTCFWGCPSSYKSLDSTFSSRSPEFAMLNASTHFKIIEHTTSSPLSLNIPVGNMNHILYIELGTVVVTLFAFVYITLRCWAVSKTLCSAHLKMQ